MPAVGALVEVTHFDMLPADPSAASFDEAVSGSADEIGNFEDGPVSSTRPQASTCGDGSRESPCDPHWASRRLSRN